VLRILAAAGFLLLSGAPAAADESDLQPVPKLAARVTDLTETLTAEQRGGIEAKLADLERRKGAQIGVLIVPTVKPESIEQYAVRVMETWKLGRKGVNDGVLLVVAKQDRKLRIEVGYGLEGALSDVVSKRIISDFITPRFKEDDFFGGIDTGIDRMVSVVSGEALPEPAANDEDIKSIMLFFLAPVLLILSFFGGRMLRIKFGRLPSAAINATATGAIAWIFFFAAGMATVAFVIAAISFALTWLVPDFRRRQSWLPSGASEPDDDWHSSRSRSRSSDDSSSSSDSSFSGGGGESGGGGSSGDW
jgi:uncharacterized protein